ncbi:MAG: hypothetical protein JO345_38075 [Streptosporangiaceae bacterium]|nr:hypothetical protein [Streptosporangiaceae bacterium]
MNTLEQWTITVCADLGIDAGTVDTKAVLGLAREVAHNVDRPAAPLTAYLVGVAVGRGLTPAEAMRRVLALVGPGLPDSYGGPGRARAAAAVPYT